jgi:hypothetical protein
MSSTISTLVRIGITPISSSPTKPDPTAAIDDDKANGNVTAVFPGELHAWIADTIRNTRDPNTMASPVTLDADESGMELSVLGTPPPLSFEQRQNWPSGHVIYICPSFSIDTWL